jgi:hypothetical protein
MIFFKINHYIYNITNGIQYIIYVYKYMNLTCMYSILLDLVKNY